MKEYDISNDHKEELYNVVFKLPKKTDLKKKRFIRYYGLKPTKFKRETLSAIARVQHYTPSAVKGSVISIRIAMFRIPDDEFSILERIYEESDK